jgi:hypothetical protein
MKNGTTFKEIDVKRKRRAHPLWRSCAASLTKTQGFTLRWGLAPLRGLNSPERAPDLSDGCKPIAIDVSVKYIIRRYQ